MGATNSFNKVLAAALVLAAAVGSVKLPACAAAVQDGATPAPYLKGRTDKDPPSYFFDEKPGTIVLARYAIDRKPAIVRRGKHIAVGQAAGLTPRFFNRLVREAGGYVPVEKGLQVDMNGSFLSVTALETGHFDFRLPFPCKVVNLKTGCPVPAADGVVPLDLVAGETRWYSIAK